MFIITLFILYTFFINSICTVINTVININIIIIVSNLMLFIKYRISKNYNYSYVYNNVNPFYIQNIYLFYMFVCQKSAYKYLCLYCMYKI